MVTKKIRMLVDHSGSPDGIHVNDYKAGETYDLPPRLAEIFLDNEWAEEDRCLGGPEEVKDGPLSGITEGAEKEIDTPEAREKKKKRAAQRKKAREKKKAAKLAAKEATKTE